MPSSAGLLRNRASGKALPPIHRFPGGRMDFVDKELTCIDCGSEFVFTAGEQLFFHNKQFQNIPKHCKKCKARRNRGFAKACSLRNTSNVCSVWLGDNGSLQTDARQTSTLSRMFSESGVTGSYPQTRGLVCDRHNGRKGGFTFKAPEHFPLPRRQAASRSRVPRFHGGSCGGPWARAT